MSVVFEIKDVNTMNEVMQSTYQLIVLDIYAEWCGPCKHLAPKLEELAKAYASPNVLFCKLDVANVQRQVKGLPTIEFWVLREDGRRLEHSITGADLNAIKETLVRLVGPIAPVAEVAHVPKPNSKQYRTFGNYLKN